MMQEMNIMQQHSIESQDKVSPSLSSGAYRGVQIGNTLYCVTSVYTGEMKLGAVLEDLAVRRAVAECI